MLKRKMREDSWELARTDSRWVMRQTCGRPGEKSNLLMIMPGISGGKVDTIDAHGFQEASRTNRNNDRGPYACTDYENSSSALPWALLTEEQRNVLRRGEAYQRGAAVALGVGDGGCHRHGAECAAPSPLPKQSHSGCSHIGP
ncbi:hypothetical protein KM043_012703 [Ampulex compressa]|nr:hypothetical protein KM043_012703 [Ampulex compressa]